MTSKDHIITAFNKVRSLEWIVSHRRNNTGIGKTFEDCIGVVENNVKGPDLLGFEIKSHRKNSSSWITLFTKSPSFPEKGANAMLRDKFGDVYPASNLKKLHTSVFANKHNTYINTYSFRLIHRPELQRIYIGVFSIDGIELDCSVYYTYSDISDALTGKLFNLLFVTADRKYDENKREIFRFTSAEIYSNPPLTRFLEMLDNGEIMYDIRIGSYKSGKNKGKPHDHGSGFRIKENDLKKLYSEFQEI